MPEKRDMGIYRKYRVSRLDKTDEVGGKHFGCQLFVLDLSHDPHAIPAIRAYARSCEADLPVLASELRQMTESHDPEPIMVPVNPKCIPDGYRAVEVRGTNWGDLSSDGTTVYEWSGPNSTPRLILEKIPEPIVLPDWIPVGWWIAMDCDGSVYIFASKPVRMMRASNLKDNHWDVRSGADRKGLIHDWLAATLPKAWHDLPWDQSAIQQKAKQQ